MPPQTLALPPVPYEPVGSTIAAQPHQTTWVEFALGLWAFSGEAVAGIEALAAAAPDANPEEDPVPADSTTGPILR